MRLLVTLVYQKEHSHQNLHLFFVLHLLQSSEEDLVQWTMVQLFVGTPKLGSDAILSNGERDLTLERINTISVGVIRANANLGIGAVGEPCKVWFCG